MSQLAYWLVPAALLVAGAPFQANDSGAMVGRATTKKLALLVGINRYQDDRIRPLGGGFNDVEKMRGVLIGGFDFPPSNISTLKDAEATRDGILSAVRTKLIANASSGDVVVFYYSGHGSRLLDQPGGDELDGYDETIVPYDSNTSGDRDIRDDTINELLHELARKTRNVTFIFDSCNSGTTSRGAEVERRILRGFSTGGRGAGRRSDMKEGGGPDYTLIAAALSEQNAREFEAANGVVYGALTYFLTEALERMPRGRDVTYRDVMDVVTQDVLAHHKDQHPQLEGRADAIVFGDGELPQQSFVLVNPSDAPRQVLLEAGQIQGITEGSVFEIFPRGSRKFEAPETPLARARVVEVFSARAKAELDRDAAIEPASRAVEREHDFDKRQLYVRFESAESSPLLRSIRDELARFDFIHAASEGERYHLLVEHDRERGNVNVEAADSGFVAGIPASRPDVRDAVVTEMKTWAKWFNVLSIRNPSPPRNVEIRFRVEARTTRGTARSPFAHVESPSAEFVAGETIVCVVESRSRIDLYLTMLDLSTDGTVSHIYPLQGRQVFLPRGETKTLEVETFVPEGRDSVTDVLKIFATSNPLDFSFVEQEPVSRGERDTRTVGSDPVEKLVAEAALGASGPRSAIRLDEWNTAERVIRVVRRPGAPPGN